MKKQTVDKELKEINKLIKETKIKLDANSAEFSRILIDAFQRYNEIWNTPNHGKVKA